MITYQGLPAEHYHVNVYYRLYTNKKAPTDKSGEL